MSSLIYRSLRSGEAHLIATIDRAEIIDGKYSVQDGALVCAPHHHVVAGWYPGEAEGHAARIERTLDAGGYAFGAWDGDSLVGVAALDVAGVGGDATVVQLEPLCVGAGHRNRGIGKALVGMAVDAVRSLEAVALYISSIPTRNTVDAYLRMGARLAPVPDAELFTLEPEDIHLILPISHNGND